MENVKDVNVNDVQDDVKDDVVDDIKNDVEDTEEPKPNLLDILDEDEDIKKQFQSEVDRMISKAIATRDKKHQEELKRQEQRSKMTAEEIQAEKERELQEREQKIKDYELRLKKIEHFKENDIPLDLIDFINVNDEEEIEEKSKTLLSVIDNVVQNKVKQTLKENGYSNTDEEITETLTVEDLSGMSTDEINAYWEKLK